MNNWLKIVVGNVLITAAYAFITVPNQIVNGGLTSFSMILAQVFPIDIAIMVNILSIVLLVLAWVFLGKEFLVKSIFSSACYIVCFDIFHLMRIPGVIPLIVAVPLAAFLVGTGYYLCIAANSSAVSFDIVALTLHKKNEKIDVAVAMRIINMAVIIAGFAVLGWKSVLIGMVFTYLQTQVLHLWLKRKKSVNLD